MAFEAGLALPLLLLAAGELPEYTGAGAFPVELVAALGGVFGCAFGSGGTGGTGIGAAGKGASELTSGGAAAAAGLAAAGGRYELL